MGVSPIEQHTLALPSFLKKCLYEIIWTGSDLQEGGRQLGESQACEGPRLSRGSYDS